MRMRMLATAALLAASGLVSVAPGGAPVGPATALVGEGRWAVGVEYGYERSDLEAFGRVEEQFFGGASFFWTQPFRIDDLESHMVFGTIAYGLCDTWDVFVRLGAANAKGTLVALSADTDALESQDEVDGSFGLAWGVGTRATFCRSGPWSIGGLMQVTWFRPGDSSFAVADPLIPDESWVGDVTLRHWQAQMALAAVYEMDCWRLWAGPFLQFVRGSLDFTGTALLDGSGVGTLRWTSELQESSQVGAHFGAGWDLTREWNLWVGGQITADSWLVGLGAAFHPERAFDL
jgi:hypothetical protein